MRLYIGTKVIKAEPMNLGDYNKLRGWPVLENEDPAKEGYLVGYSNANGKFDGPLQDGCYHISWSPKDIFDKAYTQRDNLTFGIAIEVMKWGDKVARKGWNGKNMFVVYQHGYPEGISCNEQTAEAWGMKEGDNFKCEPYLQIKMVNGSHSMWVPSINDVLAEDWEVV